MTTTKPVGLSDLHCALCGERADSCLKYVPNDPDGSGFWPLCDEHLCVMVDAVNNVIAIMNDDNNQERRKRLEKILSDSHKERYAAAKRFLKKIMRKANSRSSEPKLDAETVVEQSDKNERTP